MADAIINSLTASSLFDLTGVVAVVTGGGTGIGLMLASTLIANGANVYITGRRQEVLERVTEIYNEAAAKTTGRGKLVALQCDVTVKSEATRLADEIGRREPNGITVLFNNAGVLLGGVHPPIEATAAAFFKSYFDGVTQDHFTQTHATNAVGPYWFTFAFLPLLETWKANGALGQRFVPQVVMISSMNGWVKDSAPALGSFPYLFSKSAIGQGTSTLAHTLLPLGVRVNGIAPGLFPTEARTAPSSGSNELGQTSNDNVEVPFEVPANKKGGSVKDIGAVALALIANWFINGETVLVDGGTLLVHPSSW
ncbi:NAD(P)-binding protein [Auriscalpium vulgare]|uniref:NAD(P)-binding protein n=1 Tax=Auriscalpium vulgare TaxID=40419 RepID=A0ACB8RNC7_9AGAM|nr:NAD(P)-binding protein [Auriscalpium vulgare]